MAEEKRIKKEKSMLHCCGGGLIGGRWVIPLTYLSLSLSLFLSILGGLNFCGPEKKTEPHHFLPPLSSKSNAPNFNFLSYFPSPTFHFNQMGPKYYLPHVVLREIGSLDLSLGGRVFI